MDLRLLRYFAMVADELHFGRAAKRLNISQPPLSQQIKLLEEKIGADLFIRSHRKVELTSAGATLKEQVPLVFAQVERALHLTRASGRGEFGKLEIGVTGSMMCGIVPQALRNFQIQYPNVEWVLRELTPTAQIVALCEERLDVCFLRSPYDNPELIAEPLMREPLVVALPQSHPLTRRKTIALSKLAGEPLILFDVGQSEFAVYLRNCCRKAGFEPSVSHQVVEVQTLLSLVREGLGMALLPSSTKEFAHSGIIYRSLESPSPETTLYAIYRRNNLSPALSVFLEAIRHQLATLNNQP